MYQLEYPWLLALLPVPVLVWWLLPPYREETASVRLAFFAEVARAAGMTPASGALVPQTNLLQKILAPVCWALVVLALARPQFVDPPIERICRRAICCWRSTCRNRWTHAIFAIRPVI